MSSANLALRFVLEMLALAALGYWGWAQTDSWWRVAIAMAVVLIHYTWSYERVSWLIKH